LTPVLNWTGLRKGQEALTVSDQIRASTWKIRASVPNMPRRKENPPFHICNDVEQVVSPRQLFDWKLRPEIYRNRNQGSRQYNAGFMTRRQPPGSFPSKASLAPLRASQKYDQTALGKYSQTAALSLPSAVLRKLTDTARTGHQNFSGMS
jgi:hypothetical protein